MNTESGIVVVGSPTVFERVRDRVRAFAPDIRCMHVDDVVTLSVAVDDDPWDIVILDGDRTDPAVVDTLARVRALDGDAAVLVIGASIEAGRAARLMAAGAWDIVSGDRVALLGPIVGRAREFVAARREHRVAERALKRHRDHLRSVVTEATMAIAMFDERMDYVAVSRPWIEAYHDGTDDLVGRNQYEVNPDIPEVWREMGRRALAGEIVGRREDRWIRAEGGDHWLSWMAFPWIDDTGRNGGIVIVIEDVTAQRRATDELPVLRTRLARDLDAMKQLHAISTRFAGEVDERSLLRDALATAIRITGADSGAIRLVDTGTGTQQAVEYQGVSDEFAHAFDGVREGVSPCGLAYATGERVVVDDVRAAGLFDDATTRRLVIEAGVVGIQSTPLIAGSGRIVGTLNTHRRESGRPPDQDLQMLDLLARQLADMIERSRTIEALRETTDRYRFLFDNMLDGVAHCRLVRENGVAVDWVLIAANPACERITRLRNVVGRRATEVLPGISSDARALLDRFDKVVRTGRPMRFEQRIDALGIWLSVSVFRQAPEEFVAVFDDITESRETTARLAASEERLTLAKRATGLGVFDYDIDADAIHWDERMRELWGMPPDVAATMTTFTAGIVPADRAAVESAIGRATNPAGDGQLRVEHRVIGADGVVRHVVATGRTYFDGQRAVRIVGTVQDISAVRQLEEEGRARRDEMEFLVKQQVVAQTGAAIAHELNQPLVAISAYAEAALSMLQSGDVSSDRLVRALKGSVEQAQRAGRTLRELLQSLTKGEFAAEPVDLNEAIREAIGAAVGEGYGGFQPILDLDDALPQVFINPSHLQKVLYNLLHNSVHAMRDAGVPSGEIAICVRSSVDGTLAQVTVQDSGPGIDPETARRVFEPFFTTKPKGIGLGLAISRSLVEAHGGQLWIDHPDGPGATFHFTVPFAG